MKMLLGEKIRELRRRDGRTQEDVAVALCVTNQAVSRWESGNGYPDMELLPAIANYFHVTIDSLFGYDNERQKRIDEILAKSGEMIADENRLGECVVFLREAVQEYPAEASILGTLGHALICLATKEGIAVKKDEENGFGYVAYDYEKNRENKHIIEGIKAYEEALSLGGSASERMFIVSALSLYYAIIGEFKKAEKLATKQAPMRISKEILMTHAAEGSKLKIYQGEAILELLFNLHSVLIISIGNKSEYRDSAAALKVCMTLAELYQAIFDDGNFGQAYYDMLSIYSSATCIAARSGDTEKAKECFDRYYELYQKYLSITPTNIQYTAPLLSGVCQFVPKVTTIQAVPSKMVSIMPENLRDLLRKDERYAELFQNE